MTAREDLFEAIVTATTRGRCDEAAMIRLVDAVVTEALLAAGVQYIECQVCGAARPVVGDCPTCAFKARMLAELAARGMAAPEAVAPDASEVDPATDAPTVLYRKKPLPVEARQLLGSEDGQTGRDLADWCGGSVGGLFAEPKVLVPTLEGSLVARVGDWIVKGTRGEFWPVKGDIFAETYELVPAADTLAHWLSRRFDANAGAWDAMSDDDRSYWEHEAEAVRRAVARGGFRTADPKAGEGS